MSNQQAGTQLRSHRVPGGADTELYVEESGSHTGRPVLFIHGFSQCRLAWHRQLNSDLGRDLRLIAVDLRGHGRSQRPPDGYDKSELWADDLHAVITQLDLDRPVLCGWSYGGVVICDYLRLYGEHLVGGISLVGAASRLGESLLPFLAPEFLATLPGLFADDAEASTAALQTFVRITTSAEPAPEDFYRILGYSGAVPPRIRRALLSRDVNHDDLLAGLTTPVLLSHGLEDKVVLPAMSEYHARLVPHASTSYYAGVGHAPFHEDPDRFNAELRVFARAI